MSKTIIRKYYSRSDKHFHIVKRDDESYLSEEEDVAYDNFKEFYKAVKKDLSEADLLGYDFDDCNPKDYDLSNALISSKTMLKLGNYNSKVFKLIHKDEQMAEFASSKSLNIVPSRQLPSAIEYYEEDDNLIICYISDLHLNHKLAHDFKNYINEFELNAYFRNIVESLKKVSLILMAIKRLYLWEIFPTIFKY